MRNKAKGKRSKRQNKKKIKKGDEGALEIGRGREKVFFFLGIAK